MFHKAHKGALSASSANGDGALACLPPDYDTLQVGAW